LLYMRATHRVEGLNGISQTTKVGVAQLLRGLAAGPRVRQQRVDHHQRGRVAMDVPAPVMSVD
jgi:hypothetical protein